MAGTDTNVIAVEDRLNVVSVADPAEVAEVERQLNPPKEEPKLDPEDDDGLDHEGDEDRSQSGKHDQELDDAKTDEERELIRERRRQERRDRKSRQRDRVATLERQLASEKQQRTELAQRLLQLEQTNQATQYASLKQQEQQAVDAIAQLEQAHATAVTGQDGATASLAITRLNEVRDFLRTVREAKINMEQQAKRPTANHLDAQTVNYAKKFATENPWYKGPGASDVDSRMLTTLDNSLTAEGWDPSTETYWEELRTRMGKYLPHRASKNPPERRESGYNAADGGAPRQQRSPVAGSSGGAAGGGGKQTYRLSEERVRAMKEAGIWEDPKWRAGMIKRYQELDAQAGK